VRPEKVQVGDFPPDDGLSDDEIWEWRISNIK
jgi:hypothetical protein